MVFLHSKAKIGVVEQAVFLWLWAAGLSVRAIARRTSRSPSTVRKWLNRLRYELSLCVYLRVMRSSAVPWRPVDNYDMFYHDFYSVLYHLKKNSCKSSFHSYEYKKIQCEIWRLQDAGEVMLANFWLLNVKFRCSKKIQVVNRLSTFINTNENSEILRLKGTCDVTLADSCLMVNSNAKKILM